jgi:hypothetical protein
MIFLTLLLTYAPRARKNLSDRAAGRWKGPSARCGCVERYYKRALKASIFAGSAAHGSVRIDPWARLPFPGEPLANKDDV